LEAVRNKQIAGGGNLRVPSDPLHEIEMHEISDEFARCWQAAGRHIQKQAQGPLHGWLKSNLNPPFLEHLSFRLGNQLFFIQIEDAEGRLKRFPSDLNRWDSQRLMDERVFVH